MGTIADKLNRLIDTKEGIRQEINRAYNTEEISNSDTFNSYIQKLEEHPFYIMRLIERSIENIKLSSITSLGNNAFRNCGSLTEVSFPNATSIGDNAFNSCGKLTSVSIPNATSIGNGAFFSCSGLTSVSIPNATSIGSQAFDSCSGLTSVSIPNATSIGQYAFDSCSGLTSVSFPNATSIGDSAFESCSGLTSVSFPNATSIGGYAFQDCSNLTEASFPKATSIYPYAFYSCSKLTSASLPNAKVIETSAFSDCSSLTTLYIGTELDTVCTLSSMDAIPSNVTNIYVPLSLVDSYKSAANWSKYADKIQSYEQPAECITLSITADDVVGNKTSTTIYYTAECTYTIEGVLQEGTKIFTGKEISESFAQNTSTTNTIQRTISFTYLGKTAITTITQGVWSNKYIYVTTSGIADYGWIVADSKFNVDGYDAYMSNNVGIDNSNAVMKLECIGYTNLTIYIRTYSESYNDYTIASKANASTYPTSYSSPYVERSTDENSNSGTALSDYTAVNYTKLSGNDTIYIVYTKNDDGYAEGDDRGYVLIPKQS